MKFLLKIFIEILPPEDRNEILLNNLIKSLNVINYKKNSTNELLIIEGDIDSINNLEEEIKNTINNHNWSIKINWDGLISSRPIRRIEIFIDNKEIKHKLAYMDYKPLIRSGITKSISINSFLDDELLDFLAKELLIKYENRQFIIDHYNENYNRVIDIILKDFEYKFLQDKELIEKNFSKIKNLQLNNIIHESIGNYQYKINKMKEIASNLKIDSSNIDLFQIGKFTSIGMDYPELVDFMTKYIYKYFNLHQNDYRILDSIFNIIHFQPPTGKKDPYGLKKDFRYVLDYFTKNKIYQDLGLGNEYFENLFHQKYKDFEFLKISIDKKINILDKDLSLIKRIENLLKKSTFNEHIILSDKETKLLNSHFLEFDEIKSYINSTSIAPYIERQSILLKFINQFN